VDGPGVRRWLMVGAGMVFSIVVIGGVTRLTESGLSMTSWHPLGGLPPITDEEWDAEFKRYQSFPEYQLLNQDMDVGRFKNIYFWEYVHRMWGRAIGVVYAVPYLYFVARGKLSPRMRRNMFGVLLLIGGQGGMGWYMVKSGLEDKKNANDDDDHHDVDITPRVSPYRLAAHQTLALAIYASTLWNYFNAKYPFDARGLPKSSRSIGAVRALGTLAAVFAAITAHSGAYVAGLDAGMIYCEFPWMGGPWKLVPDEYADMSPMWRNFFENAATAQFNHRYLGISTLTLVTALFAATRRHAASLSHGTYVAARHMFAMAYAQVGLGIAALLYAVPVSLGALHQAGAFSLLTFAIHLLHELKRIPK